MRVLLNNYNYSKSVLSNPYDRKKVDSNTIKQQSPSFKSLTISMPYCWVGCKLWSSVAKSKASSNSRYNFKKVIESIINEPKKNARLIPTYLNILGKTSSEKDSSVDFWHPNDEMDSIFSMKRDVLSKIIPSIDDKTEETRILKKQYLSDLFDSGEYGFVNFLNVFKNLPDKYYKSFKEEFMNKMLYSKSMAQKNQKHSDLIFYNFKLISDLDKQVYGEYLNKNKDVIKILREECVDESTKELLYNKQPDHAFYEYIYDFSIHDLDSEKVKKPFKKKLFETVLNDLKDQPKELARALNISERLAVNIVDDINIFDEVKGMSEDSKVTMFHYHIGSKAIRGLYCDTIEDPCYYSLFIAESVKQDIMQFVKKTDCQEKLLRSISTILKDVDQSIEKCRIKHNANNLNNDIDTLFQSHMI